MSKTTSKLAKRISLTDMIDGLRRELLEYNRRKGPDYEAVFKVKGATVEASVEVQTELDGKAGVAFWVVEFGGGGARTSKTNCTVTVTLEPFEEPTSEQDINVLGVKKERKLR